MTESPEILDMAKKTSMAEIQANIGKKSEDLLKAFLKNHPNFSLLRMRGKLALDIGDYIVTADKVYAKATGSVVCVVVDREKQHLLTDIDKIISKAIVILKAPDKISTLGSSGGDNGDGNGMHRLIPTIVSIMTMLALAVVGLLVISAVTDGLKDVEAAAETNPTPIAGETPIEEPLEDPYLPFFDLFPMLMIVMMAILFITVFMRRGIF